MMDHGSRSSEVFIKKKSSSGCLIIKKKPGSSGGVGPMPRKVIGSNEERERRNVGFSISGSSEDSLEPVKRGFLPRDDRFYGGSVMYGEGNLRNNSFSRNMEFEGERRRKLDDVEFDENVTMYRKRTKKDYLQDGYRVRHNFDIDSTNSPYFGDEARLPVSPLRQKFRIPLNKTIRVQGKNGVLKVMVNKSKNIELLRRYYDIQMEDVAKFDRRGTKSEIAVNADLSVGPSLYSGLRHRENANSSVGIEKSEPKLQKPLPKRVKAGDSETKGSELVKPESTIVVNQKKNMHATHKSYDQQHLVTRGSNLETETNKNAHVPLFYSDSKNGYSSQLKTEKSEIKLQNSLSKRVNSGDFETENRDSSLNREQVGSLFKGVKSEEKTPLTEKVTLVKGKETKVKRGSGTEKQLLREKIRHKLVHAGWKIDYRPRKNRDYLDAVYISPAGTAYWSIIKAYEAFKKHVGEEDVPEELLNKLTRQTRKKMEKEMMMKQREEARSKNVEYIGREEEDTENEDNEEKLSFKPLKQKSKPNSHMIQERKTQQISTSTLLVRNFDKGLKTQKDGYVPYMGKRTVLSWLIDSGTVDESKKVQYMNRKRTKVMLNGVITREGIRCECCSKVVTVSKFEMHAGSKLRQPFRNMFLESGVSLLRCQMDAWNRQDEAKRCGFHNLEIDGDDGNDDACGVCGDGGDMICCDGCPSTFHQSCIGIQTLPSGDWHCPNCTCKFCERSSARGNALLTCSMCERKYHMSCGKEIDSISAELDGESTSFCGKKCQEMLNQLQKLLEVKHELEAGFSWSLIHRTNIDTDTDASQDGFPLKVECNSKLAVALSVIEECFLPINDRRSGINLIHNVLYNRGSNYSRLNHSGFYTAILERGDEIIAVASIRIHGTQLAEMPFIGTRHVYRRQGMCRRLLRAIELALSSLKVEKLVIPAIAENIRTWTGRFGFNLLKESYKKELRSLKMLVFPRTDMLQKTLVEENTITENLTTESGAKSILNKEHHHFMPVVNRSSDFDPSFGHGSDVCDNAILKNPLENCDGSYGNGVLKSSNTSSNSSSDMHSESNS